jgi:pyrroline-5-carboxylate reductase
MKIGLIGAGNMARALARGWGEPVLCSDSGSGRAQAIVDELGGRRASNLEVAHEADVVVLCHKPHQVDAVAREIRGAVTALVSILGGTSVHQLTQAYRHPGDADPTVPVFRIEPNTPVEVRRGVLLYAEPQSDGMVVTPDAELERAVVTQFARLGRVERVPEAALSPASAISGVGPAYLALIAEAWADAAIRHGLTPDLAGRLVTETMAGTAELLAARGDDTLAVRREVTSPGGSTARGLDALERAGVRSALADAMDAVDRGRQ